MAKKKGYLAKDFNNFRADLLEYARNYFSDQIQDFTEASVGGLFLDMAAYVGDTMSFYLDYQFNELNPALATETQNIVNHAKNAGVKIYGSAPATADVTFYIEVDAYQNSDGTWAPDPTLLPIIYQTNTTLSAGTGKSFTLDEDLDFSDTDSDGNLKANYVISDTAGNGNPSKYILTRAARCVSGKIVQEAFTCGETPVPFRSFALTNQDVSEIIMVQDSSGRNYYEVDTLSQDVIYKRIKNLDKDKNLVESSLELVPAPRRFVAVTDFRTRLTSITFGSGDDQSLDDDILPDPAELALPLYGKKTFTRFTVDPNSLLKTKTLGISPTNTTIIATYRFGGGLQDNVGANAINTIDTIDWHFNQNPSTAAMNRVINSLAVKNLTAAAGGAAPMTLDQLRAQTGAARNQQGRVVTEQDLLARIYTMPTNFGRVYRAGLRKDPRNPLATQLYILCQRSDNTLGIAPDALKKNLSTYINEFRLISDAIDVLDGIVINYGIKFRIVTSPGANKSGVIADAVGNIKNTTSTDFMQIDQPILEADVINAIINTPGVISLVELEFYNISGRTSGRNYSDYVHDMSKNKFKGLYVGPFGSIFELRYPSNDIIGNAE